MTDAHEGARLDEFTREEWFAVARHLKPELTEEDFDVMWEQFQKAKTLGEPQ